MNPLPSSAGENTIFTKSIWYRVTPLVMMGKENKPARMNPTIKNALCEEPIAATGIQIDSSRTLPPAAGITPGKR
jgi:hypothetical protein